MTSPSSLFVADGDAWQPTDLCRGPWDPAACHGGAPAALVTRALEAVPMPDAPDGSRPIPMRLARVTIELVRPVPTRPLLVATSVVRPGRKVALLEATLSTADDGVVVAMARALRIRSTDPGEVILHDIGPDVHDGPGGSADAVGTGGTADPGANDAERVPPLPAEPSDVSTAMADYLGFHNGGTEHRFVRGSFFVPGPVFDWIRLQVPVVRGEEPSPWQRAAAAADFANGIASSVGFGEGLFINPDLTVHLWREPVGEWIGMDSVMRTSPTGIGSSDSAMWDLEGRIGRTNQSLLLDHL